ncbi:hypothetical protein AB0F44_18805 [Nocardioides sp. NPDC023903]|uniref:hypothetical protein n=1 Tax=Nocardioides sp. NPDC023903 TaxID=3157195 RepID=UPI0033F9FC3A
MTSTSARPTPTTYGQLFSIPEFRVLFANRCLVMISVAASSLALGTIMYETTGSALLSALSMFGGPLVSLVVSQLFLGLSDTLRPRTGLMLQMAGPLVANTLQAVPGMPWQARFALLVIPYAVNAMLAGTQWVVLRDIMSGESYALGRSTLNLAVGGMQVVGYGLGGVALLWLSPQTLFVVAAVVNLLSLLTMRFGIKDRPAPGRTSEGVVARTRRINRLLLGSRITRPLYLAGWVPNGLIVGCEALFVPYGHGSLAGYLFAAGAAGMMIGDLGAGRFLTIPQRDRLIGPLRYLLAAPFLVFWLSPPAPVAVCAVLLASVGYAASLPLQERLITHTTDDIQGQALGLQGQGMMIGQAMGAGIGGAIATYLAPGHAMGLLAAASLLVTIGLTPGLRRSAPPSLGR